MSHLNLMKISHWISLVLALTISMSCDHKSTYVSEETVGTTLGFSGEDYAQSIVQAGDGGYFITGYTNSIRDNYDMYAIKTDRHYKIQWSKTFGNANIDKGYKGRQSNDGGFIMVGTVSIKPGNNDILCVKTDKQGNVLWSRHFGGTYNEDGRSFVELPDGGIVIAGTTESYGQGQGDVMLIKVDAQGRLKWTKTYGGIGSDRAFDIKNTVDGGFVVTGRTSSYGASVYATFLLKADSDGNQIWFSTSGGAQDEGVSVVQTPDGGFITTGRIYVGLGNYQIYLVKFETNGNVAWANIIGFTTYEESYSITPSRDGNYIITGETLLDNFAGDYQALIVKINPLGNVIWVKSYGGEQQDIGLSIQPTNKGYVIAGYTFSFGHGNADIYVLNIDEDGELQ
ncbi:hypothetical protein JNM05_03115 [bacterium]|nr:hypothetical protein [bacterium]